MVLGWIVARWDFGASIQLIIEETMALGHPSSGSWRRMLFYNSRMLFLSFQLGLKIKEFIRKAFGGFLLEGVFHLKLFCLLRSFIYYYYSINIDNN